jgi:hypothetical protein
MRPSKKRQRNGKHPEILVSDNVAESKSNRKASGRKEHPVEAADAGNFDIAERSRTVSFEFCLE